MARIITYFGVSRGLVDLLQSMDSGEAAEIVRDGMIDAALPWFRETLPQHFTPAAYGRWPGAIKPRTAAYDRRKARKMGHRNPMVWSGTFRDTVLSRLPTFKPQRAMTSTSVTMQIASGRAANLWTVAKKHNFRAAVAAMNADDRRAFESRLARYIIDRLRGIVTAGPTVQFERMDGDESNFRNKPTRNRLGQFARAG